MLQEIAKIINVKFDTSDKHMMNELRRIERKMPCEVNVNLLDREFVMHVKHCAEQVKDEGEQSAIIIPQEHTYKIKRSVKGKRIGVVSGDGRKLSFGPVWVEKVLAIAPYACRDRSKLEAHAKYLGINAPYPEDAKELCSMIAITIRENVEHA